MYDTNYLVTLERKAEQRPRYQFTVEFYADSPLSIATTLAYYPSLFLIVAIKDK